MVMGSQPDRSVTPSGVSSSVKRIPSWSLLLTLFNGVALGWLIASGSPRPPEAWAQGPGVSSAFRGESNGGGDSGVFAFTNPLGPNGSRLFLIDTRAQTLAVYRIGSEGTGLTPGTLKLESVRNYRWDLKLSEYNNMDPAVGAIESMVTSGRGVRTP
ncbi:hypothetical protein Isop_1300 [Isosphaera pallida ATCC 43644]|uniref:Uncharacterized protein n=1 Tax=Isosphaera pallida (strain ATCC 43644 / DSM 9630 / IS1B) TaxID=575540 RepID=E8QWJ4_ISOPI|nr:hypothetical protein [Isosphaera pallida]ADV61886.1 hypothetical protein Isop_1300 [Isosphaera pallida ATCC 43644]